MGKIEKVEVVEGEPPRFIIQLEDMSASLSSTIELECKVTGRPEPTIKWFDLKMFGKLSALAPTSIPRTCRLE